MCMLTFVEKTLAEEGFGACWKQEVAPQLDCHVKGRRRHLMFASLISGVAVGLGVVALLLRAQIGHAGFLAEPVHLALVLALAALAVIGAWVTVLRGQAEVGACVRRAVELHFASLFAADGNAAFGEVVLQDLVTDGILQDRDYAVTANYAGTYGACRVRMIEAAAEVARGHRHDTVELIVFRVSLPFSGNGEAIADSRGDRLASGLEGRPEFQRYHVDHDQFDGIFSVATTHIADAERIFSAHVVDTLLRVQERLASPLAPGRGVGPRLVVQFANGSLVMVIETPATRRDASATTVAGAEARARDLIVQFATLPALVDSLHGMADSLPAFSPLTTGEARLPVVSL